MSARHRVVVASTPVGPLGSGIGGGVELTVAALTRGLHDRGHHVTVVAPAGSHEVPGADDVVQVEGSLQGSAQMLDRRGPITLPVAPVLGAMWEAVRVHPADVIVNMAYDWLPFYLTSFLSVPVAHLVSMASLSDAIDHVVAATAQRYPGSVAVHTHAQAATFGRDDLPVLGNGIDVARYRFRPEPEPVLGWVGRIAPEKGFEHAVAVAAATRRTLLVWGLLQDRRVWDQALAAHPDADVAYQGFVTTDRLQQVLGRCRALLVTPMWVEAFGNVAVEAMACGVPVVAYRRGGPAEVVVDGETGFLVEPDDRDALVVAAERAATLDRRACRRLAEERYSLAAFAGRVEAWLEQVMTLRRPGGAAEVRA